VIIEIERLHSHVLLIAHRVVARILLAYYLNLPHQVITFTIMLTRQDISHLETPVNTLFCLEPKPYGTQVRKFEYDEESDWFVECEIPPGGL
jgi:6-phosphofructo-2-kinase